MTVEGGVGSGTAEKKKAGGFRRLLWGSNRSSRQVGSRPSRLIETAFLPDTSLVLEERKHQILNRDKVRTKDLPPRCPIAPPCSHYGVVNICRNTPIGRAPSPMGRIPSPMGRVPSPMGRVPSPMGRVPSPIGSPTPSPSLSTTSSRATSSPTYYCASPVISESSHHTLRCSRSSPVPSLYANSSLSPSHVAHHSSTPRRVSFRPLPPLPPPRHPHNLIALSEEDWSGDGKSRNSSEQAGEERRSGGSRSGGRRDDPRRHTLGGPQDSQHFQQIPRQTMDLESPLGGKGYGLAPSNPMLMDDDPGIMSEVETSSTGFRRGNKQRSSLPVVRTPSKTLERPLGLVFLQYRGETKRALLPNEITAIDTVKALFVRSFPKQLTMEYMDSAHVKIYIHDSSKDMFYELEDIRSHLRDIRDRSVLRLFESSDVAGPGATWDQDQSYFSEPEFDSDYQHQHIHKTKGSKGGGYYMTHSYPPGGGVPRGAGAGPLLRNTTSALGPPYSQTPTQTSPNSQSNKSQERGGRGYGSGYASGGSGAGSSFEDPYYAGYPPRPGTITPVIDEEASDTEAMEDAYGGYTVRRHMHSAPPVPYDATRMRVEHMERQLASLTGLVHKALSGGQAAVTLAPAPPSRLQPPELVQVPPTPTTPAPAASIPTVASHPFRSLSVGDDYDKHSSSSSASLPDDTYLRTDTKPPKLGRDKSVSFEKSVSFSDEPPDMNSPKQHSPQHSDRDRHKPTPPPKPVALSPGQYETRTVYRDLQLTAEMYNHLRSLQKKAKELKCEVRTLRRMCQTQAHTVRETIKDAYLNIRAMLVATSSEVWARGDEASEGRLKAMREEELYRQQMIKLENDLTELESNVEELRGNVINRKTRVNMSDVENMALVLSKSSKTVAELKLRFPGLQDSIKSLITQEMERAVAEEKFLKDEPERLESALRRCKKLTGTLVTLKRLASVQEQRLPDPRLSPPLAEPDAPVTPTSNKAQNNSLLDDSFDVQGCSIGESVLAEGGGAGERRGSKENPLDCLLDELQAFSSAGSSSSSTSQSSTPGVSTLRRLHSYPSGAAPPPPPRTTSRQQELEAKHQELLRKQKQLQEQYSRLQRLSATDSAAPALKKTGSESNLLGKMGLTLAPTGSLSHLPPTGLSNPSQPNKIYETDIL